MGGVTAVNVQRCGPAFIRWCRYVALTFTREFSLNTQNVKVRVTVASNITSWHFVHPHIDQTWSECVSEVLNHLRHPHLDRLSALPQSHLTGLLRVTGDRRDHSCSYQTIYLHRDRNINHNSSGNLLSKLIHTLHIVPAIFSCVFQQASLGWSLSLCFHWTPEKTVY